MKNSVDNKADLFSNINKKETWKSSLFIYIN